MPGPTPPARHAAVEVVRVLRGAGHTAHLAGGCVRDALMGIEPKDYDVATDAPPPTVRRLFRRSRYVGEAFGVCLVSLGDHAIEVATFRSEWGYRDGRRPDHVIFTDARHDALRRDFTINGLFADPWELLGDDAPRSADAHRDGGGAGAGQPTDRIIDYVGGVADIAARLVRAIGDADRRFAEDYLRMLRAPRFAARLGFDIETRTAAAIRASAPRLGEISRERIGAEVRIMLSAPTTRARAAHLMQALRLDGPTLGEDHRGHEPVVLTRLDPAATHPTALAAWMLDRYVQPTDAHAIARFAATDAARRITRWRAALNLSNLERQGLAGALTLAGRAAAWHDMGIAPRKRLLAQPLWPEAQRLLAAAVPPTDALPATIARDAAPLLQEGVAPAPLITGDDLIALGLPPGPAFGPLLDEAYDAQLEGQLTDADQAADWLRRRMGR